MSRITKGEETRNHVLFTAMNLINIKGYGATSITDITEATGVKKGNLYFHFSSKEDLVYAMIEKARDEYNTYLHSRTRGANSLEKLYSIFDAIYHFHKKKNFIGGCIFGNMALELSDTNYRFAQLIDSIFSGWMQTFKKLLVEATSEKLINPRIDIDAAAVHIVSSLEGAVMLSRVAKNSNRFLQTTDILKSMLEANS